jgi:hypothetical protein
MDGGRRGSHARPPAAEPRPPTHPLMTRKILIIDSDQGHAAALVAALEGAELSAVVVPHESALAQLSDRKTAWETLVVCASSEPSTLSAEVRLGEFVLRFVAQTLPHLLPRTIILSALPPGHAFPSVRAVFDEPFDTDRLIAEVRACWTE